jgi:hypothetical protein
MGLQEWIHYATIFGLIAPFFAALYYLRWRQSWRRSSTSPAPTRSTPSPISPPEPSLPLSRPARETEKAQETVTATDQVMDHFLRRQPEHDCPYMDANQHCTWPDHKRRVEARRERMSLPTV